MMPANVRGFSWLSPRMNLNSQVLSMALPVKVVLTYTDTVTTGGPRQARTLAYDGAKVKLKSGPPRKPQTFFALITLNRIHDLGLIDNIR
jgi:hypothetical protein